MDRIFKTTISLYIDIEAIKELDELSNRLDVSRNSLLEEAVSDLIVKKKTGNFLKSSLI